MVIIQLTVSRQVWFQIFGWLHFKFSSILRHETAKKWNSVILLTLRLINASDGLDVLLHLNDNMQSIFQLKSPG
jgi:hypothetical protein